MQILVAFGVAVLECALRAREKTIRNRDIAEATLRDRHKATCETLHGLWWLWREARITRLAMAKNLGRTPKFALFNLV